METTKMQQAAAWMWALGSLCWAIISYIVAIAIVFAIIDGIVGNTWGKCKDAWSWVKNWRKPEAGPVPVA